MYSHTGLSELAPVVAIFDAQLAASTNALNGRNMDGITGKAFAHEVGIEYPKLKPFVGKAISAVHAKRENHQLHHARMLSPNLAAKPNAPLRSDLRNWFDGQSIPNRIRMLSEADYNLNVSILGAGQAWSGIDDTIWGIFEDHAAKLIHIRHAGLDSGFAMKATPENITAAGTDKADVMAAADAALQQFHQDGELLDLAESYLQSVVRAMMLVFNKSFEEVVF